MVEVTKMLPEHAGVVLHIYAEGLATGQATFNTEVPSWQAWDKDHHTHSRLVAVENGEVLGWAALSPVSARYCYRGVAELSIYIGAVHQGKGLGNQLMQHLIAESEANDIWMIHSSTFPENTASINLQKKFGFREIGYRERIAELNGQWRNTVLLERRSLVNGLNHLNKI
jgi:L-amino acid N-acyltransferase YncA